MNCKEVEDILVEGGEMTEEVRRHLSECASCRSLSKLMEGVMQLQVPLEADVHSGSSWAEAK